MVARMRYPSFSGSIPLLLCSLAALAGACKGEGDKVDAPPPVVDAPPGPPAAAVSCPASIAGMIDAVNPNADNYIPMTRTIRAGGVVRFNVMGEHSVKSNNNYFTVTATSDYPCVKFNVPGTYEFYCLAHGFTGSIVVQ